MSSGHSRGKEMENSRQMIHITKEGEGMGGEGGTRPCVAVWGFVEYERNGGGRGG